MDSHHPGARACGLASAIQKGRHVLFVNPEDDLRVQSRSIYSLNKKTNPMGWLFYLNGGLRSEMNELMLSPLRHQYPQYLPYARS